MFFEFEKMSLVRQVLAISLFISGSQGQTTPGLEPCIFKEANPSGKCPPCQRNTWLEMVSPSSGAPEVITNPEKDCFNPDPITINYINPASTAAVDEAVVIAAGRYKHPPGQDPQGFLVRKNPFFRYAYDHASFGITTRYLDLDFVKKYYERTNNIVNHQSDFQLVEWPGKTAAQHKSTLETERNDMLPSECGNPRHQNQPWCRKFKYWMLQLERDGGKIVTYPCNKEEGSNIVAVGSLIKSSQESRTNFDPMVESEQKIWLSSGQRSLYKDYLQPIFVPQRILEKMAKNSGPICRLEEPDCESELPDASLKTHCQEKCKKLQEFGYTYLFNCSEGYPQYRAKQNYVQYTFGDLRTVHDFSFTKGTLVLGMRCGVLLVKGILTDDLFFEVARLQSEDGIGENLFNEPITQISASVCCTDSIECNYEGIVAAYSNIPKWPSDPKFIYISFDMGTTFSKRIIADEHSPIHLAKALYNLYGSWSDYYEILNNPDEDDLREDDEFLAHLREKDIWDSSTTQEKERLFGEGVVPSLKKLNTLKKIAHIKEARVPRRQNRRMRQGKPSDKDKTPPWIDNLIGEIREENGWQPGWTDAECEPATNPACADLFENDIAVDWLFKDSDTPVYIKSPKRNVNEPYCAEITSILILTEEWNIMALCVVAYGTFNPPANGTKPPISTDRLAPKTNHLALFNIKIKENVPTTSLERLSKRIFTCDYIINDMNDNITHTFYVQPELVRMPGSAVIFIKNCYGVIYMTSNFGNTVFNSVFYYEHESTLTYCTVSANLPNSTLPPPVVVDPICAENPRVRPNISYMRSFHLCILNVPPLITTDLHGTTILITFGKYYARGAISYNRDQRIIVGEAINYLHADRRFESIIFPQLDTNGDVALTVGLISAYVIDNTNFRNMLYPKRHALRLLPMPMQFYRDLSNFHVENLAMCSAALFRKYGFDNCKTNSFSVYPTKVGMDIGDKKTIKVRVKDINPFLPLWISSSNEDCIGVRVFLDDSATAQKNVHNWEIEVTAKPNYKPKEQSLVDAFYASDYNKLYDFYTQLSLVNLPTVRCHVQPSTTVYALIACQNQKIVAHEDSHRPQCKGFRKNFNYTLKKGTFDPELANFWIASDSLQTRPFFKVLENGDLSVTYDYSSWGCPLEPFRSDSFIPDLRIVDANTNNSATGTRFTGKFILIEIFGATGFSYSHTVRDAGCERAPQKLDDLKREWKYRKRLFEIASHRLQFPTSAQLQVPGVNLNDIPKGNLMFTNLDVEMHLNIWNRANFRPCRNPPESPDQILTEEMKDEEYEIMVTRQLADNEEVFGEDLDDELFTEVIGESAGDEEEDLNEIEWDKDHQRVYVFLAVAVDEHESLCEFQTVFGVSLNVNPDMDDLSSFLVFLFFLIFWIGLVVGGYHVRKKYLRVSYLNQARSHKLEEAAWKIVYRYEKLIHGKAIESLLHSNPEEDGGQQKLSVAARSAHDKRKAEFRMKKSHIMAQEQARHERLQKLFQKQ